MWLSFNSYLITTRGRVDENSAGDKFLPAASLTLGSLISSSWRRTSPIRVRRSVILKSTDAKMPVVSASISVNAPVGLRISGNQ